MAPGAEWRDPSCDPDLWSSSSPRRRARRRFAPSPSVRVDVLQLPGLLRTSRPPVSQAGDDRRPVSCSCPNDGTTRDFKRERPRGAPLKLWSRPEPKPDGTMSLCACKIWWPGTELNRRRQPFQGCSHPNLSSGNPYLYRRLYPHFDRSYWTHNGPNNQTHADSGVRPDSDRANGSLVVKRL
jgi:hypothetical protein